MISDVLADAISMIEQYEKDMPDVYARLANEIHVTKRVMNTMRTMLDAVPGTAHASHAHLDMLRIVEAIDQIPAGARAAASGKE